MEVEGRSAETCAALPVHENRPCRNIRIRWAILAFRQPRPAPLSVCFSHPSTVAPSWRPRDAPPTPSATEREKPPFAPPLLRTRTISILREIIWRCTNQGRRISRATCSEKGIRKTKFLLFLKGERERERPTFETGETCLSNTGASLASCRTSLFCLKKSFANKTCRTIQDIMIELSSVLTIATRPHRSFLIVYCT